MMIRCVILVGLLAGPAAAGPPGDPSPMNLPQREPIARVNPAIAGDYLGQPFFPQPNLDRLVDGHRQIIGQTGAWGSQTNILSVIANPAAAGLDGGGYANNGSQGNFWDPNYRLAYGGQDAAAMFVMINARTPVAAGALVREFGRAVISTPSGNRAVYTVVLATPLSAAQRTELAGRPPNLRVETSNGFFGYTIPSGLVTPAGQPVASISADGATILVDNWTRVRPLPVVPASAAAVPSQFDQGPYTAVIDAIRQIDVSYGGLTVSDLDLVGTAVGEERAFTNDKHSTPILNLADPLASVLADGEPFVLAGSMAGVVAGAYRGSGLGTSYSIALDGWLAGYVARNRQASGSGSTYGFLCPKVGPTWCVYSTQTSGYVLGVQPGGTGKRTALLDTAGNFTIDGTVQTAGVNVATESGRAAYLNAAGDIGATGRIMSGVVKLAEAPGCGAAFLGAHLVIADGRKPREAARNGSGVPADCLSPSLGAVPVWLSVYDHHPVIN